MNNQNQLPAKPKKRGKRSTRRYTCGSCNKDFPDKVAAQQHNDAVHGPMGSVGPHFKGAHQHVISSKSDFQEAAAVHLGATPEGSRFVAKYLDPSNKSVTHTRVPDGSAGCSVAISKVQINTISKGTAESGPMDYLIFGIPNIPEVAFVYFWKKTTDFNWNVDDYEVVRWSDIPGGRTLLTYGITQYRETHYGLTVQPVLSSMNNSAVVYAGQVPLGVHNMDTGNSTALTQRQNLILTVRRPEDLQLSDPKSICHTFVEGGGAYVPAHYAQDEVQWYSALNCTDSHGGAGTQYDGYLQIGDNADTLRVEVDAFPPTMGGGASPGKVTMDITKSQANMLAPVVFVSGVTNSQGISVKAMGGQEYLVGASSPFKFFAEPCPPKDELAFKAAECFIEATPSAFPSSFNSFGSLWERIKAFASKYISPVLKTAGPMLGLINPALGALAGGVTSLIG